MSQNRGALESFPKANTLTSSTGRKVNAVLLLDMHPT